MYYVVRAIYRITFHPLRAFPGPRLRAISHLPHAIAGVKGRQAFEVRDLHLQYGEVVRVEPDTLSFMTGEAWKDIYGHAAAKNFPKYGYFSIGKGAQPLLTANDNDYPRQRAALAHGFSDRAISGQEAGFTRHITEFIEKLDETAKDNKDIDISKWVTFIAFDIVGEFTLGMQFGCVGNSENHPWVDLMVNWMHAVAYALNATAFGVLMPFLMIFADWKNLRGIETHMKLSAEKVRERVKVGDDRSKADLWTYILHSEGDKSMSLAEMEVNAGFLVSAATTPVADAICGALYLLAKHQDILDKLRKEVESHVKSYKEITMSITAKMPYLLGVLNESMRLYTPTPGIAKRQASRDGAFVSGVFVPGGTVVGVYQLAAFTSANNFTLPDSYIPERWFPALHPDRPKVTLSDKQDACQPFGYGYKSCLGKGLALVEMKLILARFVWHFDFELSDDGFAFEKQKVFLFRRRPALNMKLRARKR
ncbi:cytochrome P450 4F3 omega-hydroxylase [Amylocarpus encephaloides]|uniref:Cytochrome P450 4F3 omega-hydroxylase n=1 Tax=Amylocarpus encephaloides TaxID=45428 RepID=A0A9P7YMF2_9HELO|nr:cytochrome P450 4F3 omega-hydroxylase [Amylocarpus encephaloides]